MIIHCAVVMGRVGLFVRWNVSGGWGAHALTAVRDVICPKSGPFRF